MYIVHLSNLDAFICLKYLDWDFVGECIQKYLFLSLLKKERNCVYVQGMDFKLRNLSNVYNRVYNIWQQTGQSNFLETVFFYHPQRAFGFGPASTRSFSIQLGIFLYLIFILRDVIS